MKDANKCQVLETKHGHLAETCNLRGGLTLYIALSMPVRLEEEQQGIVHVIWLNYSEICTQL